MRTLQRGRELLAGQDGGRSRGIRRHG